MSVHTFMGLKGIGTLAVPTSYVALVSEGSNFALSLSQDGKLFASLDVYATILVWNVTGLADTSSAKIDWETRRHARVVSQ